MTRSSILTIYFEIKGCNKKLLILKNSITCENII